MDTPKKDGPLVIIGVVLGLFGSVVGSITTIDKRAQDRKIVAVEATLKERQDERSERVSERDYLLKVTDKVIAAMEEASPQKQEVASMLIDTLADAGSQARLRNALLSAAVPSVKKDLQQTIANEARFSSVVAADQAAQARGQAVATAPMAGIDQQKQGTGGGTAVDIFWCEGGNGAAHRAVADRLFAAAANKGEFGRIRVRPLPESVNRRPGYGIVTNIIRHEDVERAAARALQAAAPASAGFGVQQTTYNTRNYISAFVCSAT